MFRRRTWQAGLLGVCVACGCTTTPRCDEPSDGPRTLLTWAGETEPQKDGAPADTAEGEREEPLASDRPDFTEASSTVGRGRVQLEAGYTFVRDRAGGVRLDSHSYPEALLRVGLFTDWFEFRIGQNYSSDRNTFAGRAIATDGFEDLYLGTKLMLTEQSGVYPEAALIVQATVPTAGRDRTADQVLPGANLLYGWDVIEDRLTFAGSLQANRSIDDGGHAYVELAQSLTAGYTLTDRLGAFTEWFAFYPTSAISPDVGPEHYFNSGFTFRVTDDLQLDVRAGVGLNRRAADFFAGSGFAVRY
jgi:hypothetical protein